MEIDIQISAGVQEVKTVKPWVTGDPDGFDVYQRLINGETVGQFSHRNMLVRDTIGNWHGGGSAQADFFLLTQADVMNIALLQVADEYTVKDKMNWLMNGGDGRWGSPIRAEYSSSPYWYMATNIARIGGVWAGQLMMVIGHGEFTMNIGGITKSRAMSQIQPGTKQFVTVVDKANNYGDHPKGLIMLPVPSLTWQYSGGVKPESFWMPDEWLM